MRVRWMAGCEKYPEGCVECPLNGCFLCPHSERLIRESCTITRQDGTTTALCASLTA